MVANDLRTSAQLALDPADVVSSIPLGLAWRYHESVLVEERSPVTVVLAEDGPLPDELWSYAQALSALLGGTLRRATVTHAPETLTGNGLGDCDLVVVGNGSRPLLRRLLTLPASNCAAPEGQTGA